MKHASALEDWKYIEQNLKYHNSNLNRVINILVRMFAKELRKKNDKSNRVSIPEQDLFI